MATEDIKNHVMLPKTIFPVRKNEKWHLHTIVLFDRLIICGIKIYEIPDLRKLGFKNE